MRSVRHRPGINSQLDNSILERNSGIDSTNSLDPRTKGKSTNPQSQPSNSTNRSPPSTHARPRRNEVASSSESLSWLPPGWMVEDRVRTSGATAGLVDRYYFDPSTGIRFRSKKEVLYYLETGDLRKKKKEPVKSDGDNNSSHKSRSRANKSDASTKTAEFKFDFKAVPQSVEWVLTNEKDDIWTPFMSGEKVPEHEKRNWDVAFTSLTNHK